MRNSLLILLLLSIAIVGLVFAQYGSGGSGGGCTGSGCGSVSGTGSGSGSSSGGCSQSNPSACPGYTTYNSNPAGYPTGSPPRPSFSSNISIVANAIRISFPSNSMYPPLPPNLKNYTSVTSITPGMMRNISTATGVPIPIIANGLSQNATGVNFKIGCLTCNLSAPGSRSNVVVEGFVGNGTMSKATFLKTAIANHLITNGSLANIGAAVSQNMILFKQMVGNYTPTGFRPNFNGSVISAQNASAYAVRWSATGNTTSTYVNITAFKAFAPGQNLSAIPTGQRVAVAYIKSTFNNTNIVNKTVMQQMYISQVISGNKTTVRYTPTNVTVYRSTNATVVSLMNLGTGANVKVNIQKSPSPITNLSIALKNNFTASAFSMQSFAPNATNLIGKPIQKLTGKIATYISINSSINDSSLSAVNYTFNLNKTYVLQNNVNPSNVTMYRYNSTSQKWGRLPTTFVSANATTYVFSTRSPGMSIYAIALIPINLTTASTVITIPTTTAFTTTIQQQQAPPVSNTLIIGAIVLIVILVLIYLMLNRPGSGRPTAAPQRAETTY